MIHGLNIYRLTIVLLIIKVVICVATRSASCKNLQNDMIGREEEGVQYSDQK